jgi:probable rRNA maturation factor
MIMPQPRLQVFCHYPEHPAKPKELLKKWRALAKAALPLCREAAKFTDAPLQTLDEVEVSLVSDTEIAQVHGDFLQDPTPTDVITFHHGEILISLDTAERQALAHDETFEREVLLYIIHGLLHLGGWDDHQEAERNEMHSAQERILEQVWRE